MNLINDEDFISTNLWRNTSLLHQRLDILNGVIARSIQLEDIIATSFVKSVTTFAFVARLSLCSWVLAVNSFGENAGTSSLSYAPRTTEKISMSSFPLFTAFFNVVVNACCPTTESKDIGRYLRAETIYSLII